MTPIEALVYVTFVIFVGIAVTLVIWNSDNIIKLFPKEGEVPKQ